MKKIKVIIALLFLNMFVFSQVPHLINYQGAAANSNGSPIANQSISIRATIRTGTSSGTSQYSETRMVTSDANGLFDFQIGSAGASNVVGAINSVTWNSGPKFLQIEMDVNGGTNFVQMGTQQLVTVPYAYHAKEASALTSNATVDLSNLSSAGAYTGAVMLFDGSQWIPSAPPSLGLPFAANDPNAYSFWINNSGNGGTAIIGKATSNHVNSTGVMGEATNTNGTGVLGKANSMSAYAVQGKNTNGIAIYGTSSPTNPSGPVIWGQTQGTTGIGVLGSSNNNLDGVGVKGESTHGRGIYGFSIDGDAIYSFSSLGNALSTYGNLTFTGGNTNPSDGSVLSGDAAGNAVWKKKNVGFYAHAEIPNQQSVSHNTFTTVNFNEDYDASGNYNSASASVDPNTFIAPVSGYYQFETSCLVYYSSSIYNLDYVQLFFTKNGVDIVPGYVNHLASINSGNSTIDAQLSRSVHLNVGDKVRVKLRQANGGSASCFIQDRYFSGNLIFAD